MLFGLSFAVIGGCNAPSGNMTEKAPQRFYYFSGAAMKNYPKRVYDPVSNNKILNLTSVYYEAQLTNVGHVPHAVGELPLDLSLSRFPPFRVLLR